MLLFRSKNFLFTKNAQKNSSIDKILCDIIQTKHMYQKYINQLLKKVLSLRTGYTINIYGIIL